MDEKIKIYDQNAAANGWTKEEVFVRIRQWQKWPLCLESFRLIDSHGEPASG